MIGSQIKIILTIILFKVLWVFSSVGLERYLDRVEVIGSNPITPTNKNY